MRKPTIAVLCLLFALSGVALADNPPEGGIGGQNTPTCSTCTWNLWHDEGVCASSPNGDWADCTGGSICYNDPIQGQVCNPYCGREHCYYV
jgi:hypothetical protein